MTFGEAFDKMLQGKTVARSIWPNKDKTDQAWYPDAKDWLTGLSLFANDTKANPEVGIWYRISDTPKDQWCAFLTISGFSTVFNKDMLMNDWVVVE